MSIIGPTLSDCTICLNEVSAPLYVEVYHPENEGRHFFHAKCLLSVMQSIGDPNRRKCPNCRQRIQELRFSSDTYKATFFEALEVKIKLMEARQELAQLFAAGPFSPPPAPLIPSPSQNVPPPECNCSIQ